LLPVLALVVWFGGVWVDLVVTGCALLGCYELDTMYRHAGYHPRAVVSYLGTFAFIGVAILQTRTSIDLLGLVLFLVIGASLIVELAQRDHEGSLLNWALTLSGTVYVGWTFAHAILLRHLSQTLHPAPASVLHLDAGAAWIATALLVTFASDTSAYVVGRIWGRHRMAPYISPKKSWEGAIGGVVGAMISGWLLVLLLGLPLSPAMGLVLGGAGSLAGQAGDLAESLIKRQVGVKDSGHLIPGHGGLLDRADSLLFTFPVIYYLAHWLTA